MFRSAISAALYVFLAGSAAVAQVQNLGDTAFSVPEGWQYAPNVGAGFGMMTMKQGNNFWAMTVFTPWPSSGNANTDLNTAGKGSCWRDEDTVAIRCSLTTTLPTP